jgi:starch synthase (maltosyl-transferring)
VETPSSVIILDVRPRIDDGRYPIKREVGDRLIVSADIFKDGHDKLSAVLQYRPWDDETWSETDMRLVDNDRWEGSVILDRNTRYQYRVTAYPNALETWLDELGKKFTAGLDVGLELREGEILLEHMASRSDSATKVIDPMVAAIRAADDQAAAVALMTDESAVARLRPWAVRDHAQSSLELEVIVDRVVARSGAWYSLFPRSQGRVSGISGTFDDVIARLPAIADMGFNVLYLLPIHPISTTNRKGKNNAVVAAQGDPGVPYAIGSPDGGHDAIEPSLGTIDDFDRLVAAAASLGMEIALDVAIQAAPDHPWARTNPDWFTIRPDGSIKYAENPPKKYEDIYPINFSTAAWRPLWEEMLRIIRFWVEHGVKTFRVDNPHTKPVVFWEWLIREVHRRNPEVIFLSEAFTRPKMMAALAKAGFAQSYTYFTWRNDKREIIDYAVELTSTDKAEYMRGNFFPNTHDILPRYLQTGGRPAFQTRLVLAATLSSVYGITAASSSAKTRRCPVKRST